MKKLEIVITVVSESEGACSANARTKGYADFGMQDAAIKMLSETIREIILKRIECDASVFIEKSEDEESMRR